MVAYYNDSDPFCCQWLRNLMAAGLVPGGYVDERSIADVEPDDLRGFALRGALGGHRPNGCDGADGGWQEAHGEPGARSEVGFWSDAVWLPCLDGKARRVEPAIQPLAAGIPNRVGLLRGSGNAITPQAAAAFIKAVMEVRP